MGGKFKNKNRIRNKRNCEQFFHRKNATLINNWITTNGLFGIFTNNKLIKQSIIKFINLGTIKLSKNEWIRNNENTSIKRWK